MAGPGGGSRVGDEAGRTLGADRETLESRVREVLATMRGDLAPADLAPADLAPADLALRGELEALAAFIRTTRAEIAALSPHEIATRYIPSATDELDAIVAHTEEATGTILDSAEQVEALADGLDPERRDRLRALTTRMYEACNFQDITGQRITKVVQALQTIEARIEGLVAALAVERLPAAADAPGAAAPRPGAAVAALHGPALQDDRRGQAEIDALFDSLS